MLRWIMVLMVVVPAVEIWLLFETGRLIGGWQTFLLILVIGSLGAIISRREGRRVLEYARNELNRGTIPTSSVLDGICVFAGGILLVTPGFVTDLVGLLLVFPATRFLFKGMLANLIRRYIERGNIRFYR